MKKRVCTHVGVLLLGLGLALSSAIAYEPVIDSVDPEFGFTDEDTGIVIRGDHFTSLSTIELRDARGWLIPGFAWLGGSSHWDAELVDGYAYVASESRQTLKIVDVRDVHDPQLVGSVDIPGWGFGVAFSEGYVYVAGSLGGKGLAVVDARDPSQPVFGRFLRRARRCGDVKVRGDLLYAACNRFLIFDISKPGEPRLLARSSEGFGFRLDLGSGVAILTSDRGIRLVDVEDPAQPSEISYLELSPHFSPMNVLVSGTTAYVIGIDWSDNLLPRFGIYSVDVSDPSHPIVLDDLELEAGRDAIPWALAHDEETVFVGLTNSGGLALVDVSNPENLKLRANLYEPPAIANVSGVGVADGFAYLTRQDGWFLVLDLRDPPPPALAEAPTPASWFESPDQLGATVPAELDAAPYHVVVTNQYGWQDILYKGYRACERRPLSARLELAETLDPVARDPAVQARWSLGVNEKPPLERGGSILSHLALPELPDLGEIVFEASADPTTSSIQLQLFPQVGRYVVTLEGADEELMRGKWTAILDAGGMALAAVDEHQYGDIQLLLGRGQTPTDPLALRPILARPQSLHRYEFTGGKLAAASAWGPNVDHVFRAKATYDWTCEVEDTVSFRETRRSLCEEWVAENPGYVVDCKGL